MMASASWYLPMGLGAQLGLATEVRSAVTTAGDGLGAGVGGGGGGGGGVLVDEVDVVGLCDEDVEVVEVVMLDEELFDTELGAGTLRTCPGCKSLAEIPGFAASRAATETPCSAAILARVSPVCTLIATVFWKRTAAMMRRCARSMSFLIGENCILMYVDESLCRLFVSSALAI